MKIKSLLITVFAALAMSAAVGCAPKSNFVDYAHNGSCQLKLDYKGHDFFKDGIGEVILKTAIDGDTAHFTVKESTSTELLKARFYGIDTPESTGNVQPYGKKASRFTAEKLNNAAENGTIVVSSPASTYTKPEHDSTGTRYLSLVWINETKKNAPISELTLLNLWVVQEGLSWAKNVDAVPEYADVFQDAQNQAEKFKLMMWSGEPDDEYNSGDYEDTPLSLIKEEIVAGILDPDHGNAYSNKKVRFTGTVSGFADNTLYVQECYETEADDGTVTYSYAGINVFTGMQSINPRYTEIGAYLQIVGLCVNSDLFGFQVTDTQGHWAASPSTDPDDCQVILPAADNKEVQELYTFEYTSAQIDALHNGIIQDFENLYCRTKVTNELVCRSAYISESGDITLYFKDTNITAYIPFQYYGNLDDTSDIWNTSDRFVGKSFLIEGTYSYHKTAAGKIVYQIVPSKSADIICTTEKHGTIPSEQLTVDEAVTIASRLDGNKKEKTEITYYVSGSIKEVTSTEYSSTSNLVSLELEGSNSDLVVYKAAFRDGLSESLIAEWKANLVVGTVVYLKGLIQNYDGTPELVSGTLLYVYPHGTLEDDPLTVGEAIELINELDPGAAGSPAVYYYVEGEIASVETEQVSGSTRYNLTLVGGLGVYQARLQGVDASKVVVGETALIKGKLYNDNGSPFIRGATYIIDIIEVH